MSIAVAYRYLAWIVGLTTIFVCVAFAAQQMTEPISWWNTHETLIQVVDQVHGFLFMGVLVLVAILGRRHRWEPFFIITTMILATIPFVSFWAERRATRAVGHDPAPAA